MRQIGNTISFLAMSWTSEVLRHEPFLQLQPSYLEGRCPIRQPALRPALRRLAAPGGGACTSGLKLSALLAVDGRRIRIGMPMISRACLLSDYNFE